jgi:GPI mannosyltransferase 2
MTLTTNHHQYQLRLLAASAFAFTAVLALTSASLLPLFDQSPQLIKNVPWIFKPVLRWDALHFIHIVEHGYMYEHEWAFFPGLFAVIRVFKHLTNFLGTAASSTIAFLLALFIACDSAVTLYRLSLNVLGTPSIAFLAAQLSLIPSSPVTLWLAPYTEPLFTYLSYRGQHVPVPLDALIYKVI